LTFILNWEKCAKQRGGSEGRYQSDERLMGRDRKKGGRKGERGKKKEKYIR